MPRFVFDLQLALDSAHSAVNAAECDVEAALKDCDDSREKIRKCAAVLDTLEREAEIERKNRVRSARASDRLALDAWLARQHTAREQAAAALRDAKMDLRYFEVRVMLRVDERAAAQNRLKAYERLREAAKAKHAAKLLRREDEWSDELAQQRIARERREAAR